MLALSATALPPLHRPVLRCLFALALLLAAAAPWLAHAQAQADARRGFLYEIRKGAQVSYLFGTLHVGRPEFYPLPPSRQTRLEAAQVIVLEADISDLPRALAATAAYARYADDAPGLDVRLPPALRQRVEAVLARNTLDPAPMWRLKPWMLASALALFEAAQAGYAPGLASEAFLIRHATAADKPVLELEGIEFQFRLFDSAPEATQFAYLDDIVRSIESGAARREINRIAQAWETADRAAAERLLAEMAAQSGPGARFIIDALFLGRHPAMLARLQKMMSDGRVHFFAVGALHLVGPQGLVAGLRARGFTVTEL